MFCVHFLNTVLFFLDRDALSVFRPGTTDVNELIANSGTEKKLCTVSVK